MLNEIPLQPDYVISRKTERGRMRRRTLHDVNDELVKVKPMLDRVDDWAAYLSDSDGRSEDQNYIEHHTRTGRSLGDMRFVAMLETLTGKQLGPKRPGRKFDRNSS